MGRNSKRLIIAIAVIIALSTTAIIKTANAQIGVTTPITPGFEVEFKTFPHYVSPVYGVDNVTGKAVLLKDGYAELYKWVAVSIGGQPFLRYNDSAGHLISLSYEVRWKGNHDTTWQTVPQGIHFGDAADQAIGRLISIGFKGIDSGGVAEGWMALLDPTATKIDFQVQAMIGYWDSNDIFVGKSSGWSATQILAIPTDIASSPTPTVPEFSVPLAITFLIMITVAVVFRRKHPVSNYNNSNTES
jgi:hypothetical protein